MLYVDQTRPGKGGNCLQACIASIFDLDLGTVPDFAQIKDPAPEGKLFEKTFPNWWIELNDFLRRRGLLCVEVVLHEDRPWTAVPWDFVCIFSGFDVEGNKHAVVGCVRSTGEFQVIWNPACGGNMEDPGITSVESLFMFVPLDPSTMTFVPPPEIIIPTKREVKNLKDGKRIA